MDRHSTGTYYLRKKKKKHFPKEETQLMMQLSQAVFEELQHIESTEDCLSKQKAAPESP